MRRVQRSAGMQPSGDSLASIFLPLWTNRVSPQDPMLKPNPEGDGIRRWAHWGWLGWRWRPMNGTSVLIEDPAELPCPFQAGSTTQELRGGLPPDSGSSTPILQNWEISNSLLLRPLAPKTLAFVPAASTYWDTAGAHHRLRHPSLDPVLVNVTPKEIPGCLSPYPMSPNPVQWQVLWLCPINHSHFCLLLFPSHVTKASFVSLHLLCNLLSSASLPLRSAPALVWLPEASFFLSHRISSCHSLPEKPFQDLPTSQGQHTTDSVLALGTLKPLTVTRRMPLRAKEGVISVLWVWRWGPRRGNWIVQSSVTEPKEDRV